MLLLRKIFFLFIFFICFLTVLAVWLIKDQGVSENFWRDYSTAKVVFDEQGIPTITGKSWQNLVEAQGYVVASERLWQMDLMRRAAAGKLSAWFGKPALEHDIQKVSENWQGVAENGLAHLTPEELEYCQLYANGVNQFILEHPGSWGFEYTLMQEKPEAWQCSDSLVILLHMAEYLSGHADEEAKEWQWRKNLSTAWQNVIFPKNHPWAKPIFGTAQDLDKSELPQADEYIPMQPLSDEEKKIKSLHADSVYKGSNGWVWTHGKKQKTLLANDTHLFHGVPMIWFANRLRIDEKTWVAGVSLPGIPGVVIGMNQNIAWGFTNQGDDVDDYLAEEVDEQKGEYRALAHSAQEFWRKIIKKKYFIKVKDRPTHEVEAWFTHRGPLAKRKLLGNQYYSRQWLPLRPGMLALPIIKLNQARDWLELNAAFDRMLTPPQAVIFADRLGNIGLRSTGIGIKRMAPARWPVPASEGEWLDLEAVTLQRKLLLTKDGNSKQKPQYLAVANAQLWHDDYGHHWSSDDRRRRIEDILSREEDFSVRDFEKLQRDTHSRYHQQVLTWIMDNVRKDSSDGNREALFIQWQKWDGFADSNAEVFTHAIEIDQSLTNILLQRIKLNFYKPEDELPVYDYMLRRGFIWRVLHGRINLAMFGLTAADLSEFLLEDLLAKLAKEKVAVDNKLKPQIYTYLEDNTWQGQHPFVGKIPWLGNLFKVTEYTQTGFPLVVKVEAPKRGATFRIVWDLMEPINSTWNFPVGQSGHVRSKNYRNLQKNWFEGKSMPVFDKSEEWR